jgi:hypothetical protein
VGREFPRETVCYLVAVYGADISIKPEADRVAISLRGKSSQETADIEAVFTLDNDQMQIGSSFSLLGEAAMRQLIQNMYFHQRMINI